MQTTSAGMIVFRMILPSLAARPTAAAAIAMLERENQSQAEIEVRGVERRDGLP